MNEDVLLKGTGIVCNNINMALFITDQTCSGITQMVECSMTGLYTNRIQKLTFLHREDSNHYLLLCPLYFQARITMLNKIRHVTRTHISCDLLLYGAPELDLMTNYTVFDAVHEFISSTDRL